MSIFSRIFGSKKMDEELAGSKETLSQNHEVFDDPATQVVKFNNTPTSDNSPKVDVNPDTLPEAIRYVVGEWGKEYLKNRGFINVLNDFKVLKDIPAAKHIITNMQANGYMEKITLAQNWALESKSISIKYADEFGAREDIVGYIVKCIGYGLQFLDEKPVYVEPSTSVEAPANNAPSQNSPHPQPQQPPQQQQPLGPYDPKLDLENYQYPTLDLLEDHSGADIVSIKSVLRSAEFQNTSMELPCALGKKDDGSLLMFDLAEAPHLMISGASGMGVSVCFNTIITSLLYKKHPAEMKFVLIDPKKIEFSLYSPLQKHFLVGFLDKEVVVTDMGEAYNTLRCVDKLLNDRLELFKEAGVRDVKSYNRRFCERKINPINGHGFMPYIIVVIDEYDELIRSCGKGVEVFLDSISRMGRTTGIHLIISVQRPVATVISAGIKSNIPTRMSFRVTSANDSRNILGISGAEKLQRPGEMIYTNGIEVSKAKCAYTDLQEVERINDFICNQQGYGMVFELPDPDNDLENPWSNDIDMQHLDPLFEDAARLIVREQSGSTSLIQRKFAIGYNRANRMMDQLEKAGIVGEAHGSTPREVYIKDEWSLNNVLNKYR